MHLVRLQRMVVEILHSGNVNVLRPDHEELLAIRDGALSFDELEVRTSEMSAEIDAAARVSQLPERPDEAALTAIHRGVECDLTTNEAGSALTLLLDGNGNMLERILSPSSSR